MNELEWISSSSDEDDIDIELLSTTHSKKERASSGRSVTTPVALFAVVLTLLGLLLRKDNVAGLFDRFLPKNDDHIIRSYSETVVKDYMSWHNRTRTNIDRGQLQISDVRWLVWKGSRGIGDRFRGIMNVLIAAIISERLLLIDWGKSIPIDQFVTLGKGTNLFYNVSYLGPVQHIRGPRIKHPSIDNLNLFLSNESVVVSSDNSKPRMPALAAVHRHFPHLEYSKKVAPFWNGRVLDELKFYHMLLSHLLRQTSDFFYEKAMTKFDGLDVYGTTYPAQLSSSYISIHVRYGEGLNEEHLRRFNFTSKGLNESTISACIANEAVRLSRKQHINPGVYFLATDTPRLRNVIGREIVKRDVNGTLFFGRWNTSHISSLKDETEENYKALEQTFLELFLLSEGAGMVNLNSGFANLAKWIGKIEDSRTINLNECTQQK